MSFNYRVVQRGDEFAIHEVYYHPDGTVASWTENAVSVTAPSVHDLRIEIQRYLQALERPALRDD